MEIHCGNEQLSDVESHLRGCHGYGTNIKAGDASQLMERTQSAAQRLMWVADLGNQT